MPGKGCGKKGKPHTPITSKKQQGFMGAELARKRAGKRGKTGMSQATLARHLKEAGGKKLPTRSRKKK